MVTIYLSTNCKQKALATQALEVRKSLYGPVPLAATDEVSGICVSVKDVFHLLHLNIHQNRGCVKPKLAISWRFVPPEAYLVCAAAGNNLYLKGRAHDRAVYHCHSERSVLRDVTLATNQPAKPDTTRES